MSRGDFSKVITCRTNKTAKMSDICERAYSPSSIRALFEGFRLQAENCLLFLKSVTKLSIHVKAASSQSPQLLFEATSSPQVPFSRPLSSVYISLMEQSRMLFRSGKITDGKDTKAMQRQPCMHGS